MSAEIDRVTVVMLIGRCLILLRQKVLVVRRGLFGLVQHGPSESEVAKRLIFRFEHLVRVGYSI
jgi:hypothetical protein